MFQPDLGPMAVDDLSCLLFQGSDAESSGIYRPLGYELRLRGTDVAQHHLTHLHEIHHKVLNDDTAWGSLIHIAARHPDWGDVLGMLIANSRIVHEAFASFMAASLAQQRHPDIDSVLDAYPVYRPLVARMRRVLAPIPAGHRQELAATGIARLCMSSPVLELAADRYPSTIGMADVPSSWLPDQRFAICMGAQERSIASACRVADERFVAAEGRRFEELELSETDEKLDSSWDAWESDFVHQLRRVEARISALPQVGLNEHLPAATRLARSAEARGMAVPLPHESEPITISDAMSVQRLLAATEIILRAEPWQSMLAELGRSVDVEQVLALSMSNETPFLVIHGHSSAHLAAAFRFEPRDQAVLEGSDEPVFAVRLIVDDHGRELLLHATIPDAAAYQDMLRRWPDQHVAVNCVTASCFLDVTWQRRWLPALSGTPTVVLLDLGLLGMVGEGRLLGASGAVHGVYIGLGTSANRALAWHVEGHPHVMLAIGDDLTVQLVAGQLEDLLGDRLRMSDSDWSAWLPSLSAVCASVMGTERSLRFDGFGGV